MPFRNDVNQKEIVDTFRRCGAVVDIVSHVGNGFPDIIVNYKGLFSLVEIKTPKGKLRKIQKEWFGRHNGLCFVVRDKDDANDVMAIMSAIAEKAKRVIA